MKYEDVVIGMKVMLTADYGELPKGSVFDVLKNQTPEAPRIGYFIVNHNGKDSYLAPHCEDFEPFEMPLTEQEIFESIIVKNKWYAGLRTDRGNYHTAQSANQMVRRYRKGTLSADKIKQIFNKHGWIKPEVQWEKV